MCIINMYTEEHNYFYVIKKMKKKIEEESNLEIKLRLQEMMNAIYIDGEMVDNSYKTCKICGQNIGTKIEDEFLGFDSATGAYKLQSEVWYAKTEEEEKKQKKEETQKNNKNNKKKTKKANNHTKT